LAYDEGLAQIFEDDLSGNANITSKKMFGGLCFFNNGHMVCGVHQYKDKTSDMAMFRTGPDRYAEALCVEGVQELSFTGRPMKGMVECDAELLADDVRRIKMLELALAFTNSLPPK